MIKKMPTKELLEDFLKSLHGEGDGTYFDIKKGEFVNPILKKKLTKRKWDQLTKLFDFVGRLQERGNR